MGGDDTPPSDAPAGPSGLIIAWSSSPADWPSTVSQVTLEQARFAMNSLRVIGDAGPGDERTTETNVEMRFGWDSVEQRPSNLAFDSAPTGRYSQVALVFDRDSSGSGPEDSYELRGEVVVGSETLDFKVSDTNAMTFDIAIDERVMPGEMTTIGLRINFTHALDSIDWTMVNRDGDRLELEEGDSQIGTFRTKLKESFEVVSSGI